MLRKCLLIFSILIIVLILLLASTIGSSLTTTPSENLFESIREAINQKIQGLKGREVPEIALYPEARRLLYRENIDTEKQEKNTFIAYYAREEIGKVSQFYSSEMKKLGWKEIESGTIDAAGEIGYLLTFAKDNRSCGITLIGKGDTQATLIQIALWEKYKGAPAGTPISLLSPLTGFFKAFSNLPPLVRWSIILAIIILLIILAVTSRILNIVNVIRCFFLYSILAGLFTSAYLLFALTAGKIAQLPSPYTSPLITAIFIVIVVCCFQPVKNRVQKLIDKIVYRHELRYRDFLQQFSQTLSSLMSLEDLSTKIAQKIREGMELQSATLLLYDEKSKSFTHLATSGSPHLPEKITLKKDGDKYRVPSRETSEEIVWEVKDGKGFVRNKIFETILVHGYKTESGSLAESRESLHSIPLWSKGKMVGMLNVGRKTSGGSFSPRDINLLSTLAPQIAIALENAQLYQETLDKRRILNELMRRVSQAHEEERRRISRDLHDGIAQNLSGMIFNLDSLKRQIASDIRAQNQIKELEQLATGTIADLRKLIYDLRPATLDSLGLVPTIEKYIEQFKEENRIEVNFKTSLTERLPTITETSLFRLIQEALNNVKKHAQATQVSIGLEKHDQALRISIEDDGKGFDLEEIKARQLKDKGFGLIGMKERVESLGGDLKIVTHPGGGTKIIATVPLRQEVT